MNNEIEQVETPPPQGFTKFDDLVKKITPSNIHLPVEALEEGKIIILNAGSRKDIYKIEQEFLNYANQNPPKNIHGAFLGFVKKKLKEVV